MHTRLVHVPSIKSSISSDVRWKETQRRYGLDVERQVVGHITFIERKSQVGKDHVSIAWNGCCCDSTAISPQIFFLLLFRSISLFLIGAPFDTNSTIRIALGLTIWAKTVSNTFTRIILSYPRVDVLHIKCDRFPQTRDFLLQCPHCGTQEILQHWMIEATLLSTKPAVCWHGALHIEPIWLIPRQPWSEADFE